MIQDLMEKYHIDSKHSFMVGDKVIDGEAGRDAGIQGILVRHAHSREFPFFKTLLDFANSLKKE